MKTKKISKKLNLNKKNIANLSNVEKGEVKGGLKWECSESPCDTVVKPSGCGQTAYSVCIC